MRLIQFLFQLALGFAVSATAYAGPLTVVSGWKKDPLTGEWFAEVGGWRGAKSASIGYRVRDFTKAKIDDVFVIYTPCPDGVRRPSPIRWTAWMRGEAVGKHFDCRGLESKAHEVKELERLLSPLPVDEVPKSTEPIPRKDPSDESKLALV